MQNAVQREHAEKAYRRGAALVQEHRYPEAINELRRTEELFRNLDARGHPFNYALENGVSGLANTLHLLGRCHLQNGDLRAAIDAFETSMVNERFERSRPFRTFRTTVHQDLLLCYESVLSGARSGTTVPDPVDDLVLDVSYRFPFSLPPEYIPIARLYELDPPRYEQFHPFYDRYRQKDASLRRASSRTDDRMLRTISIGVWSILGAIWLAYGIVVARNLLHP